MRGTHNTPEISVLIRKDGKILFVRREHTGYCDGMYALPGGHVEADEPFSDAGCREVLEEVDVTIKPADLIPLHTMHRMDRPGDVRVGILFEASKWAGEAKNMELERHGPVAWLDAADLPYDEIMPFQADILRSLERGEIYFERGWKR